VLLDAGRAPPGATALSRASLEATGEEDVHADRASREATACPRPAWATGAAAEVLVVADRAPPGATACGRAPLGATVAAVDVLDAAPEEHVADRAPPGAAACGRAPLGATVAAVEPLVDA
jgi:hypothetical protein